ncbi:MAG: glycosyltransferase family 4 protein [Bacteroidetes bacterium]|nr:glycosyltransferase family 4 protein [Bacteroidota bacterium]
MKKILFMVHVPPPVHGAALRNESLFMSSLLRNTFDIRLHKLSFASDINDIGKFSIRKIWRTIVYAIRLCYILLIFRPNLAYFGISPIGGAFYRDALFAAILRMFRVRITYHVRGMGIRNAMQNGVNRWLYHFVFDNAYLIILAPSQTKDIEELYPRKTFIVPNGIKMEGRFGAHPTGSTTFLFLSNLVRKKGVFEFIDNVKALSLRRNGFKARIVGADGDVKVEEVRRRISELGLTTCIQVDGGLYGRDKFAALEECFCLVFPTTLSHELFPGVILEAMQCGRPVITTAHAAIPDIVEDGINGYVIDPSRIQQMVDRMEYLLDHPDTASSLGVNGREKFERLYTLEQFEMNMKQTFETILNDDIKSTNRG